MKKFLKVFTSTILVIAMVLTGLPALPEIDFEDLKLDFSNMFSGITEAFAGSSGGDDTPEVDHSGYKTTEATGTENASPNAGRKAVDDDTYILSATMNYGVSSDVCKYVIIKYYASADAKSKGIVSTQFLSVNAGNDLGADIGDTSTFVTGDYAYLGAKSTSFAPFVTNSAYENAYFSDNDITSTLGQGGTSYTVNGITLMKNYDQYHSWAKTATGADVSANYPSASEKASSSAFQPAATEYIRFRFEYGFYELVNLAFYCEYNGDNSGGVFAFGVRSWTLYKHDGEFDENNTLINGATTATNYAFVSNSLSLAFDGTKLYESVTYDSDDPSTYDYTDTFNMQGEGGCTFTFVNADDYDDYEDYVTGFSNIYFFKKCKGTDSELHVSSDNKTILNFGITFSDTYGAGIDAYMDAENFNECMYAEITFLDTSGIEQVVTLPVITNSLLEFAIPVDEDPYEKNSLIQSSSSSSYRLDKISNGEYLCYAHEGDTIYFSVEFPDFGTLTNVLLKYRPIDPNDYIIIDSIDVYDNNGVSQYAVRNLYQDNSVDGSAIDMSLVGPKRVYTTTADSTDIQLDSTFKDYDFEMAAVDGDSSEEEVYGEKYKDRYLVSITTANDAQCATSDQVNIVLKYRDWNGKELTAPVTNIYEAAQDFYGSNKAVITKVKNGETTTSTTYDASYYYGMSAGQTIQFYITASNVEEFTSLSFEWADEDEYGDFWQISHVKIEKLQNETQIGKLLCAKVDQNITLANHDNSTTTIQIKQIFGRNISGLKTMFDADVDLTLTTEGNESYDLLAGDSQFEATEDTQKTEKMEQYKYSLNSGLSAQDLELGEASVTYQVQVEVAGNSNAQRTDDCGSNNRFYFQLTFASFGQAMTRSAYVLANQQLTADGFRAGYTECFTISLNEQVGDVTGINIIIDDISADSTSDDKLNINEITIVKQNKSDIDQCWVIENVGWIGTEYVDDDEAYERETRSETDLVQKFPVSYSSYMLELEFALTWGAYDTIDSTDAIQPDELTTFVGNLLADVSYTVSGETGGQGVLSSQQCVQLMAEYTGQTAISDDDITFVSDPSYMFRAGHTNRFIITLKKAAQVNSIRFTGYASTTSSVNYIPLASMSVSIVLSEGAPRVDTTSGDFYRKYNEDPVLYCSTFSPNVNNIKLAAQASKESGAYSTTFKFKDCADISALQTTNTIASVVTREPESANDTMNVYLYLSPETPSPATEGYSLNVRLYTGVSNSQYTLLTQLDNKTLKEDTAVDLNGQKVVRVYKEGIEAPYMQSLKNINVLSQEILANGTQSQRANYAVQYAVVQQVRDGVVINTYKVNFSPQHFASNEYGASMSGAYTSEQLGAKQLVTLQLGDGSMTADLVAETYDIAVAIRYKSNVSGDRELLSPYVFASDAGVETVHAGSILEFEFNEAYVGSIEGISVYAMNGLEATLSAATIKTYETVETTQANGKKTSDLEQTCIYSIVVKDDSTDKSTEVATVGTSTISSAITSFDITGKELTDSSTVASSPQTLKRANFGFTVMSDETAGMIDSGGKDPIRAIIGYKKGDKVYKLEVADLRQYTVDDTDFTSGNTVNVSFFIQGATALSYIELEPYDDSESSTASLNLNSVSFQLDDVADTSERTMCYGGTIYEGSPAKINLSSIVVELAVKYMFPSYGWMESSVKNDTMSIIAEADSDVTIVPTITDSKNGFTVRIYRVVGDSRVLMEKEAYADGETFIFPAVNGTSETVEWLVEISASEIANSDANASQGVKSYVKITVPGEGQSVETTTDDTAKTTETTDTTDTTTETAQ